MGVKLPSNALNFANNFWLGISFKQNIFKKYANVDNK